MSRRTYRVVAIASVVAVMTVSAAGCAKRTPALQPVSGKLLLDGSPLPLREIRFEPEAPTAGLGGGCQSDEDGHFELIALVGGAVRPMKGAVVGAYRVIVRDSSPSEKADRPGIASSTPRRVAIPSKYGNFETTPLRVEVTRGENDITLELKTR